MQPNPKPRLARLLRYLDLTPAAFAKRVGLSQSYISRLLNEERGGSERGTPALVGAAHAKLGLHPSYWMSGVAKDPAECLGERLDRPEPVSSHIEPRGALADLANVALEHDEPAEMIKDLLRLQPPPGAGVSWYVREYARLLEEHRRPRH